ncbi:MAG: twin-arginine translocase TatA/TatE family subunit [Microbacterium sp.]|nr:twin-arginine translocase TatA/TatE family subunit [Microbacterium sp.]
MLGLTFDKILILGLIAAVIVGPRRLPAAARWLGRLVRNLRTLASDTPARVRDEVGPEFDEIDWTRLDPRQYDPRRLIRDALTAAISEAPPRARTSGEAGSAERAKDVAEP